MVGCGVGVFVGVDVRVGDGVKVGVRVGVAVLVGVNVAVGLGVGVSVGVAVAVWVEVAVGVGVSIAATVTAIRASTVASKLGVGVGVGVGMAAATRACTVASISGAACAHPTISTPANTSPNGRLTCYPELLFDEFQIKSLRPQIQSGTAIATCLLRRSMMARIPAVGEDIAKIEASRTKLLNLRYRNVDPIAHTRVLCGLLRTNAG